MTSSRSVRGIQPLTPQTLRSLAQQFPLRGRVDAIFLRPARLAPVISVLEARAEPGLGLIGDRRSTALRTGDRSQKREVTLFQAEHLPAVAQWCGLAQLDAGRLRRNLLISGINLLAMRSLFPDVVLQWQIGDGDEHAASEDYRSAVLELTGPCDPCSRMEAELGSGAYNALRGHGGMTARVLVGGTVRVGDVVRLRAGQAVLRDASPSAAGLPASLSG